MEKEFVPYEIALQLKELGFNEPCFKKYIAGCLWSSPTVPEIYENIHPNSSDCLAPTFSQVFRWFREKSGLKSWIQEHTTDTFIYEIRPHKLTDYKEGEVYVYKVYEEAELALINKLIEIIKNK